jgi:hypothetical protein
MTVAKQQRMANEEGATGKCEVSHLRSTPHFYVKRSVATQTSIRWGLVGVDRQYAGLHSICKIRDESGSMAGDEVFCVQSKSYFTSSNRIFLSRN